MESILFIFAFALLIANCFAQSDSVQVQTPAQPATGVSAGSTGAQVSGDGVTVTATVETCTSTDCGTCVADADNTECHWCLAKYKTMEEFGTSDSETDTLVGVCLPAATTCAESVFGELRTLVTHTPKTVTRSLQSFELEAEDIKAAGEECTDETFPRTLLTSTCKTCVVEDTSKWCSFTLALLANGQLGKAKTLVGPKQLTGGVCIPKDYECDPDVLENLSSVNDDGLKAKSIKTLEKCSGCFAQRAPLSLITMLISLGICLSV